jgi:hypothetical protein
LRRAAVPAAIVAIVTCCIVGAVQAQDEPPARPEVVAPARIALHRGPRIGDTLERTVKQRDVEMKERTSIVGSGPDGTWIVERSGPAWPGLVLRLVVDTTGRTLRAEAGAPGAARRSAISIGEEAPEDDERPAGVEEVRTVAGVFRCQKRVLERQEPFPISNARWLVEGGARAGLLVREESRAADRLTRLELVAVEDVVLRVADGKDGLDVPCVHATLQPSLDGVPSPPFEQWTAIQPLIFGETLVRLDNGLGRTEITRIAHDGTSAFPR